MAEAGDFTKNTSSRGSLEKAAPTPKLHVGDSYLLDRISPLCLVSTHPQLLLLLELAQLSRCFKPCCPGYA